MFEKYRKRYTDHRRYLENRRRFATTKRDPFYAFVSEFLPENPNALILDVGSGDGTFPDYIDKKYQKVYLIEGNPESAARLLQRYENVLEMSLPNKLPLSDESVSVVHCSHVLEHMTPNQVYQTLVELDRVLCPGGVLVIACPFLEQSGMFYDDLSHIKPYNPTVFRKYLCANSAKATAASISTKYSEVGYVDRWSRYPIRWEIEVPFALDILANCVFRIADVLGIVRYQRSGYVLVLRKGLAETKPVGKETLDE